MSEAVAVRKKDCSVWSAWEWEPTDGSEASAHSMPGGADNEWGHEFIATCWCRPEVEMVTGLDGKDRACVKHRHLTQ